MPDSVLGVKDSNPCVQPVQIFYSNLLLFMVLLNEVSHETLVPGEGFEPPTPGF